MDMEIVKEVPGYKAILKAVIKMQMQQLVEQLEIYTGEESMILTASVSDGSINHLGSDSAKCFLDDNKDVKIHFLKYCLQRGHEREGSYDNSSSYSGRSRSTSLEKSSTKSRYEPYSLSRPSFRPGSPSSSTAGIRNLSTMSGFDRPGTSKDMTGLVKEEPPCEFDAEESGTGSISDAGERAGPDQLVNTTTVNNVPTTLNDNHSLNQPQFTCADKETDKAGGSSQPQDSKTDDNENSKTHPEIPDQTKKSDTDNIHENTEKDTEDESNDQEMVNETNDQNKTLHPEAISENVDHTSDKQDENAGETESDKKNQTKYDDVEDAMDMDFLDNFDDSDIEDLDLEIHKDCAEVVAELTKNVELMLENENKKIDSETSDQATEANNVTRTNREPVSRNGSTDSMMVNRQSSTESVETNSSRPPSTSSATKSRSESVESQHNPFENDKTAEARRVLAAMNEIINSSFADSEVLFDILREKMGKHHENSSTESQDDRSSDICDKSVDFETEKSTTEAKTTAQQQQTDVKTQNQSDNKDVNAKPTELRKILNVESQSATNKSNKNEPEVIDLDAIDQGTKTPVKQVIKKTNATPNRSGKKANTAQTPKTPTGKRNFIDKLISTGIPIIIPDEDDEEVVRKPRSAGPKPQLHYNVPPQPASLSQRQATQHPLSQQQVYQQHSRSPRVHNVPPNLPSNYRSPTQSLQPRQLFTPPKQHGFPPQDMSPRSRQRVPNKQQPHSWGEMSEIPDSTASPTRKKVIVKSAVFDSSGQVQYRISGQQIPQGQMPVPKSPHSMQSQRNIAMPPSQPGTMVRSPHRIMVQSLRGSMAQSPQRTMAQSPRGELSQHGSMVVQQSYHQPQQNTGMTIQQIQQGSNISQPTMYAQVNNVMPVSEPSMLPVISNVTSIAREFIDPNTNQNITQKPPTDMGDVTAGNRIGGTSSGMQNRGYEDQIKNVFSVKRRHSEEVGSVGDQELKRRNTDSQLQSSNTLSIDMAAAGSLSPIAHGGDKAMVKTEAVSPSKQSPKLEIDIDLPTLTPFNESDFKPPLDLPPLLTNQQGKEITKSFACGDCGKTFSTKHGLSIHFKTHTKDVPFECDICGKHYSKKGCLTKHILSHYQD